MEQKCLHVGVLEEISIFFSKFADKSTYWGLFFVKLQHVMAYNRLLDQLYQKRNAYRETLTQLLSGNFEKKYEHGY